MKGESFHCCFFIFYIETICIPFIFTSRMIFFTVKLTYISRKKYSDFQAMEKVYVLQKERTHLLQKQSDLKAL